MYSLRVELTDELHKILSDYSKASGFSMTDVVRSKILTLPVSSASTDALIAQSMEKSPRLLEKLIYWTRKRLSSGFSLVDKQFASEHVANYLHELGECSTIQEINMFFSCSTLSRQEKLCISHLAPILRVTHEAWQKLRRDDAGLEWYDGFGPGEYCVLTEAVLGSVGKSIVTRNQYDCQVLNADNMMIVDVDLLGNSSGEYDPVIASSAKQAINALEALCYEDESLGFNVYRTAAGLRYICTSKEFDPASRESRRIMRQLYADPRYRNLCEFQETYRARLTPKPWRVAGEDCSTPEDAIESGYRTCEYLGHYGSEVITDGFAPVIKLHDETTAAMSEDKALELA